MILSLLGSQVQFGLTKVLSGPHMTSPLKGQNPDGRGGTCSLRLGVISLRVYSPSGVLMYHEAVISLVENVVDWVYVMERILHNHKRDESVQVHLTAEDDAHTCFGVGSNFGGTFWCDETWWDDYVIMQLQLPSAHNYTGVINVTAVFSHTLRIGDLLREHHDMDYWTLAEVLPARSRGQDFRLVHNITQTERTYRSLDLWYWHNAAGTQLSVLMNRLLTRAMPQADEDGCVGCAMLLIAPGDGPGSRHSRRVIRFPSHNALCLCRVGPTSRLAITTVTFD